MHAVLVFSRKIDIPVHLAPDYIQHIRIEILGERTHLQGTLRRGRHQIKLRIYHARNLTLLHILADTVKGLRRSAYKNRLAVGREQGTIDKLALIHQGFSLKGLEIQSVERGQGSWSLGETVLTLSDKQIAGIGRDIIEIDVVITEGDRLENSGCQIIFCKIGAIAPARLTVIRFLDVINLCILLSALGSDRIDQRFLVGSKLKEAFRNICCQNLTFHRQRIDSYQLLTGAFSFIRECGASCGISISLDSAFTIFLHEIHFIAARHPLHVFLERSKYLACLIIPHLIDTVVVALTVHPGFAHNHIFSIRRE